MKRPALLAIIALVTIAAMATIARGAVLHVPPGTSPNKQIAAARSWDVVQLQGGVRHPSAGWISPNASNVTIRGDLTRPAEIAVTGGNVGICIAGKSGITLEGIRLVGDKPRKDGRAIQILKSRDITLRGVTATGFWQGVTVEGDTRGRCRRVLIENSDISGNYPADASQNSEGIFVSYTDGFTLRRSRVDTNGWKPGVRPPTVFNHNVYIHATCTGVAIEENAIARAGNYGLELRPGGICRSNLFLDNGNHLTFGLVHGGGPLTPGGVAGSIDRNVFIGGRSDYGHAIELGNIRDAAVTDNLIAHGSSKGGKSIVTSRCNIAPTIGGKRNPYYGTPQGTDVGIKRLVQLRNYTWAWPGGPNSPPPSAANLRSLLPADLSRDIRGLVQRMRTACRLP